MEMEMELQQAKQTTYDQFSIEQSKNFVNALQELKNLRPQLYSAAEYCEKSYLYSEHKQMALNNLKDYAAKALVNAIDHLGSVTYKLSQLLEHQTLDISTMELKIAHLDQQLLTCQIYAVEEGLKQHQLLPIIPRHQKHYTLPKLDSVNKKVHFSPQIQIDPVKRIRPGSWLYPSATNSVSWNLESETKSTSKGALRKSKVLVGSKSFDNQRRKIVRQPTHSDNMLSALFLKHKPSKFKTATASEMQNI